MIRLWYVLHLLHWQKCPFLFYFWYFIFQKIVDVGIIFRAKKFALFFLVRKKWSWRHFSDKIFYFLFYFSELVLYYLRVDLYGSGNFCRVVDLILLKSRQTWQLLYFIYLFSIFQSTLGCMMISYIFSWIVYDNMKKDLEFFIFDLYTILCRMLQRKEKYPIYSYPFSTPAQYRAFSS